MSAKLLPCPFCGCTPHTQLGKAWHDQLHGDRHQDTVIKCPRLCVTMSGSPEAVRDRWNTRADLAREQVAAVKVKPLVWELDDGNPACQDANGCGKLYRVIVRHDGTAVLRHNASIHDQETYGSEEAAKAAALTDLAEADAQTEKDTGTG